MLTNMHKPQLTKLLSRRTFASLTHTPGESSLADDPPLRRVDSLVDDAPPTSPTPSLRGGC